MSSTLSGRTVVMSGGSRGIGLAIATRLARDGANVALLAKTDDPHPRLAGTIHTAVAAIEAAGGQAIGVVGDVRREEDVARLVDAAVERFGGIDVVINNASAIDLRPIAALDAKRYDLMLDINARGTFLLTRQALPLLREADDGQVLTLSPPLSLDPRWLRGHAAYTVSKFAMTMLTLGVAADEAEHGVRANCLWPRTMIATAAVRHLLGDEEATRRSRTPEIVSDAAHALLTDGQRTGETLIDDELLAEAGVDDLDRYAAAPDGTPALDIFVADWGR